MQEANQPKPANAGDAAAAATDAALDALTRTPEYLTEEEAALEIVRYMAETPACALYTRAWDVSLPDAHADACRYLLELAMGRKPLASPEGAAVLAQVGFTRERYEAALERHRRAALMLDSFEQVECAGRDFRVLGEPLTSDA